MLIELKKLNQPNRIWYAVVIDGRHQSPYYSTQAEAEDAYEKAIEFHKKELPSEVTLFATEL